MLEQWNLHIFSFMISNLYVRLHLKPKLENVMVLESIPFLYSFYRTKKGILPFY